MGIESWLVLLAIVIVFLLLAMFVMRAEDATYYYNCYCDSTYKKRAYDRMCKGIPKVEKCKGCPYHKRYERSLKK